MREIAPPRRSNRVRISAQPVRGSSSAYSATGAFGQPVHCEMDGSRLSNTTARQLSSFAMAMPRAASDHRLGMLVRTARRRSREARAVSTPTNRTVSGFVISVGPGIYLVIAGGLLALAGGLAEVWELGAGPICQGNQYEYGQRRR